MEEFTINCQSENFRCLKDRIVDEDSVVRSNYFNNLLYLLFYDFLDRTKKNII